LGNYISGLQLRNGTGREASHALIREVSGITGLSTRHFENCPCERCERRRDELLRAAQRAGTAGTGWGYFVNTYPVLDGMSLAKKNDDPQDHDRRYLAENGGCIYIDLNHLELCLPETRSALDHVACWHAGLRIVRRAMDAANAGQPEGRRVHVLVNNSDGSGNSYGSHLNFLVTRRCWQSIFERKMQYLLFLAAYQASSVVFAGQGKVGSENGAPDVHFQLSQRADYFEQIVGSQTTCNRPIVNSRDEPLCGDYDYHRGLSDPFEGNRSRVHVIFYDNTLCHVSTLLKAGVMQIILAMIEAGFVERRLILDDPLAAVRAWSHDPGLRAKASLFSGERVSAVEMQYQFLEEATRFVSRGDCEGIVPDAQLILDTWGDTLALLEQRDVAALSRKVDWALKLTLLEGVMSEHGDLDWAHPAVKRLDHVYSSLDAGEGLYWACERDGHVERVVAEKDISRFESNPPEDTRAWARAMLIRRIGADRIEEMNWDHIRYIEGDDYWTRRHRTIELPDPLGPGKNCIENADSTVSTKRSTQ
jgi:proteasome accessory factor A